MCKIVDRDYGARGMAAGGGVSAGSRGKGGLEMLDGKDFRKKKKGGKSESQEEMRKSERERERKGKREDRREGQTTPEMEIEPLFHLKKEEEDLGCQQVTQWDRCVGMRVWARITKCLPPRNQKSSCVKDALEVQLPICIVGPC